MKVIFRIIHFLILMTCLAIQVAFIENLKLYHIDLDLVLVALVLITIYDGAVTGILFGFAVGMALDLAAGNIVGISPLIFAVSAFTASRLTEIGFKQKLPAYIFIIFIITEINVLLANMIRYLFNFNIDIVGMGLELLLRPIYNILLILAVYPLLRIQMVKRKEFGI